MDIWERMYEKARVQYHPEEVSPFIYAHNVVAALEAENGEIYTGFCIESCSGVMNMCAERVAALNMYVNSGQTKVKRFIAFRDEAPTGGGSGMPCGACREFFYQLNEENENMEIMVDYEKREIITLKELMPNWWGKERYEEERLEKEKMQKRIVDNEITLVPYYRNDEVSLAWYQDLDVCKQVDNRDEPYDLELLHRMYDFLSSNGDCFYIEYKGILVGDVSLRDNSEIAIVVSKDYQNQHIGRRCVMEMLKLAREKEMESVQANIYSFNEQSKTMFESIGFIKMDEEWFRFDLK